MKKIDLEKNVTSLEVSRQLFMLTGKSENTVFKWGVNQYTTTAATLSMSPDSRDYQYSAYTVQELWDQFFPGIININESPYRVQLKQGLRGVMFYAQLVPLEGLEENEALVTIECQNAAEALGLLAIRLFAIIPNANQNGFVVESLEEGTMKHCEKCGLFSGPALHNGCDQSSNEQCVWYTKKNELKNEDSLMQEIVDKWGPTGWHVDVLKMVVTRAKQGSIAIKGLTELINMLNEAKSDESIIAPDELMKVVSRISNQINQQ